MGGLGLFFVAAGIFSMSAACYDWDWFMNARKARFIVGLIGRTGARVFYALVGTGLAVMGALALAGVVQIPTH